MGIILSEEVIPDSLAGYGEIGKEIFDFVLAVETELNWLSEKGIVDLTPEKIQVIISALSSSANGSMQYWTGQHSALPYNSWYEYDEASGVWGGQGVDGVKGVRGCSVVGVAFEMPAQGLESSAANRYTESLILNTDRPHPQYSLRLF